MTTCPLCSRPGSAIASSDRRCSFDAHGIFRPGGLWCGTIGTLLSLAPFKTSADGIESAQVGANGVIITLAWTGHGSRVEFARVARKCGAAIASEPLTIQVAEDVIAAKTPIARRAGT